MGNEIVFDYSKASGFIREEEIKNMKGAVLGAKDVLLGKTGAGNDFLGWIDLPVDYDKNLQGSSRRRKRSSRIRMYF